jgi:hypothetical protein
VDKTNNPTFQQSNKLDYFILGITQADEIYAMVIVQSDAECICKVVILKTQEQKN